MSGEARADLLIELGCEELPPLAVDALRESLFSGVADGLGKAGFEFDLEASKSFSTPRRLAVLMHKVAARQPDQDIERRGPALAAAFDADGKPTRAAEGFAQSVGLPVDALETRETDKGAWLYCQQHVAGKALGEALYEILETALRQLPIPRPMRWSDHDFSFARPVHWLVVMHGASILEGEILGCRAGRTTRGHRVHSPGPHEIPTATDYEQVLLAANVIADPDKRREKIEQSLKDADENVLIDSALLDEVNNLVEWPVAVVCEFESEFLEVPHAALIASMQDHQKFFPVGAPSGDSEAAISNRFIAISNVDSRDFDQVRTGFERVIRPRLADARFFLEQDERKPLEAYGAQLDEVVFQEKIGTIGDKMRRVAIICKQLSTEFALDAEPVMRAARLCKCDLMTQMVGEFPELQGQMGEHYARASGEPETVARAIGEHYAPRFAGDTIPQTPAGLVLSLADRADTLVACFAAGLAPSGNKDPFALRRAALGLVRILNEGEWEQAGEAAPFQPLVPLRTLFGWAADNLDSRLPVKPGVLDEVVEFVVQRSRGYFADQGFGAELLNAALGSNWAHIPDLRKRLVAVNAFTDLPEAASLAQANKRIGNILRKAEDDVADSVDESALELDEESRLFAAVVRKKAEIAPLLERGDYHSSLKALAALDKPVNDFFDGVMVMDEDPVKRRNRLALLASLKSMFDEIADLSVLG